MPAPKPASAYAAAGVDIDAKMNALKRAKRSIQSTTTPGVLSTIGSFGGLFQSPGSDSVLVSSIDGVGTKLNVAVMAGRHDTIGQDIVNHCVNDILVQGATPLFFLDYIGTSTLDPRVIADIIAGVARACKANHCALIGGETAELPNLYPPGEYDLVGAIIGVVKKKKIITGQSIRPGDVIIGLPSSGLHTNGYSLARKIVFQQAGLTLKDVIPGTTTSVAAALLAVHRSYLKPVLKLMSTVPVRGMAHLTGGGFYDNIPRVLPDHVDAVIEQDSWTLPPLFRFLQEAGSVTPEEMHRVFNMGIGYVVIVRAKDAPAALAALKPARPRLIGRIVPGRRKVELISG
ncbi:MAG TPA: phosphoribosylformylglycinamidine cyclo-ligase [Kiritimatiellia bacterium]|nr:phosphoribosylformylglycinamidine cyclo-ligase [Kiritimatiellia bacterium]